MGPFSHYVLARQLLGFVQPEQPDAFLWGALAPDVRYLAGLRREQTHLDQAALAELTARHPACVSFIQGYRVHCLLDEIDIASMLNRPFPAGALLRMLRKPLSMQQAAVMVELHFIRREPGGALTGSHNPILGGLGIQAEQSTAFAQALADYVARPAPETALLAFRHVGMISDERLARYDHAYRTIRKRPALQVLLAWAVRSARIEQRALAHVHSRW